MNNPRSMRAVLVGLLVSLLAASASAQTYRFKSYTVNDGLGSNAVYSVFQDHHGYLWFSTDSGLSRYDGADFRNFGLADGLADVSVRAVVEDQQGQLWIATKGGLSRWDGKRFHTFRSAEGLAHDELRCALASRDGSLWFGTSAGLSHYVDGRFENFGTDHGLPRGPVWALHEGERGELFVGIRGGGLLRRAGARFLPVHPGLGPGTAGENVFDIEGDGHGGLWVATGGGLAQLAEGGLRLLTEREGLPSNSVSSVLRDARGRVWVGTFGGGLARVEGTGVTVLDRPRGLPDPYVTALYADYEGGIWIASMWRGVSRFLGEGFRNYGAESGLGEGLVTGIAQSSDGALWFSTVEGGLARRDAQGRVQRFGVREGLLDRSLWALLVDSHDRVWVGGPAGVSRLEGGRVQTFDLARLGVPDRIDELAEDARGWIWIGSSAARSTGLLAWDGHAYRTFGLAQGLVHTQVNDLLGDRAGNLWISTENGLGRFDGSAFSSYGREQGLPHKRVIVSHEDAQGRLWFGTGDGLALLEGQRFRVWRREDGLPSSTVTALASASGTLWVGTPLGLATFDGRSFRSYGVEDGLNSQEISSGAALLARDGTLWFGTAEGAVQQVPLVWQPEPAPRLVLSAVVTPRRRLEAEAGASFELAPDESTLTFLYAGLAFRREGALRYSSRLEGFENEWSPERSERAIRFTNLPPGDYRFAVRARVADGPWSPPALVALRLAAPWWATRAFRASLLVLLLGLGYAGYALRMRAWRRDQERLLAQRQRAQQELLASIRAIHSSLDLGQLVQNLALEGARLLAAEPSGIGLLREGAVVFERLWKDGAFRESGLRVPVGEGLAGQVASSGVARLCPDPARLPGFRPRPGFEAECARAHAAAAIRDRLGAVVGVLEVRCPQERAPFTEADLRLLELFAHQAAVALENATLYGDVHAQRLLLSESVWAMEELWKNEQRMREQVQELDRLKTNFMIVSAHEMRTPLTILKGHHEALLSGALGQVPEGPRRFLEVCRRSADRLAEAFSDIVEMLRFEGRQARLRRRRLELPQLIAETVEAVQAFLLLRGQTLTVECEEGLPPVLVDPDKLQLALANLLQNAIRFTPDGGRLQVRLARESESEVRLSVIDSGIGIEASELERIFERFYTSMDTRHHRSGTYEFRTRGAGLGLALVRANVEAHGGRVWAESLGPERGSSFHMVLPIELLGLDS